MRGSLHFDERETDGHKVVERARVGSDEGSWKYGKTLSTANAARVRVAPLHAEPTRSWKQARIRQSRLARGSRAATRLCINSDYGVRAADTTATAADEST
jgi:hypothetical protein